VTEVVLKKLKDHKYSISFCKARVKIILGAWDNALSTPQLGGDHITHAHILVCWADTEASLMKISGLLWTIA